MFYNDGIAKIRWKKDKPVRPWAAFGPSKKLYNKEMSKAKPV
jgi:hypothetical protein